jgi:dTDP-4-dehydrorhamnose reductase
MLGQAMVAYLSKVGYRVTALRRADFDIAREPFSKFAAFADKADVIVNAAGVIKPLIAKTPIEDVLRVNTVFPRNLAKFAAARNIQCLHITTDCVFSGLKGGYTENDAFDADDVYGMSKNGGDHAECMTLRTSIIGEEKGQARSLLEWARSQAGKEANGFTNHLWNGVTTVHLAEIVDTIVRGGLYRLGLFHVHSPSKVTKAELVQLISDAYELGIKIKPMEAATFCDRTLASIHKLSSEIATKPLAQQLAEMRRFFATTA